MNLFVYLFIFKSTAKPPTKALSTNQCTLVAP